MKTEVGICIALSCFAFASCDSGTATSSSSDSTSTYSTITVTLNGTTQIFQGYTPYDCEYTSNRAWSNGVPVLAIYAYSGGCEFCGDTLTISFTDTTLPNGESLSCDSADHIITYDQPGEGAFSASPDFGGSCTGLQINSFSAATGSAISGSFTQAILVPSQGQVEPTIGLVGGTFNCSNLLMDY